MAVPRTALVTGASRGIGRAVAERLASDGFSVCLNYLGNSRGAMEALEGIHASGGHGFIHRCDVSSEVQVAGMVREVEDRFGSLGVLVNNAGIYERAPFEDIDFAAWRRTLSNNLDSAFLCTRAALPLMRKGAEGRIIYVTSQLAFKGSRHGAHYAASKAGMIGLTRSLAIELGRYGITVNMVAPGSVMTRILDRYDGEQLQSMADQTPSRRIGQPSDVASAVSYLATDEASYINGATLSVSGGTFLH